MVVEDGVERIKKTDIPKIRGSRRNLLKDRLFPEFESLSDNDALKIETKKLGVTLAGLRYVIRNWNEKNPYKSLTYTAKNSRKNPIIFIYRKKSSGKE